MTFSLAETFLLLWAVLATIAVGLLHTMMKRSVVEIRILRAVVCEVASGDLVAKKDGDTYTVENDDFRMVFRREK